MNPLRVSCGSWALGGRWALGSGLLFALSRPASAQNPADTTRLRDLVVTATRIPTPASAIAQATTVLRGDDLRARGIRFVLDALRDVPGITVVQTGSYGAVTSVFLRGGASNDIKVLLDGVPLNLPGGAIDFANLSTDDLDRIEIVRGPASVLYGSDAVSGVVQLFTRRAPARRAAEVAARAGSRGTSDVNANLSVASRQASVSATGSRFDTDGSYAFNSGYRNTVGSAHASFGADAIGRASFTVRYSDATAHFPTDGSGKVVDHNQFSTERSLALGLDASRNLGALTVVHVQAYGARLDQGYTNRQDTPADTIGFAFTDDRLGTVWRRGVEARIDRHFPRWVLLSIGAGLEHETDREHDIGMSNFGFGASHDTSNFAAQRTTQDAYVQLLSDPVAVVSFQAGARADHNSAFGDFVTWRIGATWHPSKPTRVWVSEGTAFKAPTFPEQFARSPFEVGNPGLTPERSRNGEVGGAVEGAGGRVQAQVAGFWQQFRELIQYVNAAPGEPTYHNLGAVSARGIEVTGMVNPVSHVTFAAHWTWLHTAVTDTGAASSPAFRQGARLIRRPQSSGGATVSWQHQGFGASAAVLRVGERDDIDFSGAMASRVILPAYTTMDVTLNAPLWRSRRQPTGIDVTLRAENVFDAAYQQAVGFPGRGRTVFAGGRVTF